MTKSPYNNVYAAPVLTTDFVVFSIQNNRLMVLLIKRLDEPFINEWALPGGYIPAGETTVQGSRRIMAKKVGLDILEDLSYMEQLYTFDMVARDPRGHAVSVTYFGCLRTVKENQLRPNAAFFPVDELPPLAFDHDNIIHYAHKRIASKISYTNLASAFLNKEFTLTSLQKVYESVYGHKLDKRNFRKKILKFDILNKTEHMETGKVQRPARLYKFKSNKIEEISEFAKEAQD